MADNPHYFLLEPLTSLKNVGINLSKYLATLIHGNKIFNLLLHFPNRTEEISYLPKLNNVKDHELVILKATIEAHIKPKSSKQPYKIICYNEDGYFNLLFFKIYPTQIDKLKIGKEIAVFGKITKSLNETQIHHPTQIVDAKDIDNLPKINKVYPLNASFSNKFIIFKINEILSKLPKSCPEWIPYEIMKKYNFHGFYESLRKIHENNENINNFTYDNIYRKRLVFDETLSWQLAVIMAKNQNRSSKKFIDHKQNNLIEKFINNLPFQLTQAQLKAIDEINNEIFSPKKMIRLVHGDVGSGKTIVAITASIQNIIQNKQVCILVPTTVLANQHYAYFSKLLAEFNFNIAILTSATSKKNKTEILKNLENGSINIIIATHAILEDNIIFKNLGIAIIDEQHRFGVMQRLKISAKGNDVDLLLMSATPIPRSLMMGLYGDMDISIINEKPKNRQNISTSIMSITKSVDLYNSIKNAINNREKIYWICPAIEENEEIYLTSAQQKYQELISYFNPNQVALLHGKIKDKEKEKIMQEFANNDTINILVATTVIEVGIDVPSATIIIIENAEHFGLAQLHQLRGRVGRSDKKSYCILLYGKKYGENSQRRLNILRESNDGFFIAEQDLKMRGSGELIGTKQSGVPEFLITDLNYDHDFLNIAHESAKKILDNDPKLENIDNKKYQFLLKLYNYNEFLNTIYSG